MGTLYSWNTVTCAEYRSSIRRSDRWQALIASVLEREPTLFLDKSWPYARRYGRALQHATLAETTLADGTIVGKFHATFPSFSRPERVATSGHRELQFFDATMEMRHALQGFVRLTCWLTGLGESSPPFQLAKGVVHGLRMGGATDCECLAPADLPRAMQLVERWMNGLGEDEQKRIWGELVGPTLGMDVGGLTQEMSIGSSTWFATLELFTRLATEQQRVGVVLSMTYS